MKTKRDHSFSNYRVGFYLETKKQINPNIDKLFEGNQYKMLKMVAQLVCSTNLIVQTYISIYSLVSTNPNLQSSGLFLG